MAGAKRMAPEEEKGGTMDVRKLIGRFRSKSDIYDYLLHHRKLSISIISIVGQYYMPPKAKVTKDFLKLVFSEKKDLIPMSQLRPVTVPKYDKLSVKNLITDVMSIPELAKFFPA